MGGSNMMCKNARVGNDYMLAQCNGNTVFDARKAIFGVMST